MGQFILLTTLIVQLIEERLESLTEIPFSLFNLQTKDICIKDEFLSL